MQSGLTITELADLTGMTARNIRAHQSRGLLTPPRIHGRVAYYDAHHVARLELISSLQREGFTLGAIKHLLESSGSYAAIVAGRRQALREGTADIAPEVPMAVGIERIRAVHPQLPERCLELGLLRREGDRWLVPIAIAGVGRTLVERGVPIDYLARLGIEIADVARSIASQVRDGLGPHTEERESLLVVAVQLFGAVFEAALTHAVAQEATAD